MADAPAELVHRLRAAGCDFAEDEARLLAGAAADAAELERMAARRVAGLPLEQVLGWAEFCGLRIAVDPGVFVPRRRTELIVRLATASLAGRRRVEGPAVVVDLCCGAGAIGAAVADRAPGIELHAADVDPAAVACARRNVLPAGGRVHAGDLYAALPGDLAGRVAVLTVNAPYVPTDEIALMPPEARLYEPPVALDGGDDGLDLHRRVAAGAPRWLAPGGVVLVETSRLQADRTAGALAAAGLRFALHRDDDLDATVVSGRASN